MTALKNRQSCKAVRKGIERSVLSGIAVEVLLYLANPTPNKSSAAGKSKQAL